jgi:lysophospholipase L1-like esterase
MAEQSQPARVMPLGDSITAGSYGAGKNGIGGYRPLLWAKCQQAGLKVEFVGTWNDPSNAAFNAHHQGWRGGRIEDLNHGLAGWVKQCKPEVILLQIGVNDLIHGTSAPVAASGFDRLLDTIQSAAPDANVYASSIMDVLEPNDYKVQSKTIKDYNARIAALVEDHARKGFKLRFVDVNKESALQEKDFSADHLHPNDGGYGKMAQAWFKVLRSALKPGRISALTVGGHGRFFVDAKGQPVFWQGDTEWELFHFFSVAEAKALMEKRRSQGFNVLQVMATGLYPEASLKRGALKGANPGEQIQPWENNDPLTPNESYFRQMDAIVEEAAQLGLTLVVGVYHAQDQGAGRITVNNARPWAKFLAQRYKNSPNIVWSMYPQAMASSEAVIRATVDGLREGDDGAHLITMHPDPSPASSSFMHSEPWLSFNTLQTFSVNFINYDMVRADYLRMPPKVVVDGEARYEDEDGTTPFQVRRAGYWACLAGGFYSYGHRNNWISPRTWRQWWDAPGARQTKIMGDLFRSITWWKLLPDQAILVNPVSGNVAARASDGDWLLAYLTTSAPVSIQMNKLASSGMVDASWINPVTGIRTHIGRYANAGTRSFTMPAGWEDAVLLCEKAER